MSSCGPYAYTSQTSKIRESTVDYSAAMMVWVCLCRVWALRVHACACECQMEWLTGTACYNSREILFSVSPSPWRRVEGL